MLAASGRYRAVVCSTGGRVAPARNLGRRAPRRVAADPVDRPVGAPAQRGARAQLPRAAASVPLRGRGRHLRLPRQRLCRRARRAQRATSLPRPSTMPSGALPRSLAAACSRAGRAGGDEVPVCRSPRPGKGVKGADRGLAHNGPSSPDRRARPRRRGAQSPLGPRWRRGGRFPGRGARWDKEWRGHRGREHGDGHSLDGSRPARGAAQPVRRLRRPRRAVDRHADVSRALGPRRQRGDESRPAGDRHRRRRRRRRRVWCGMATTAWWCRPATAPRSRPAMRRLAADPALRARLGEAGREDVRAFTYDAWAAGFSRAFASLGVSQGD